MSEKEIKVSHAKLAESNGDLGALADNWSGIRPPKPEFRQSRGSAMRQVSSILEFTEQVSERFLLLLQNTEAFFQESDAAFREADDSAAQSMDSLSR